MSRDAFFGQLLIHDLQVDMKYTNMHYVVYQKIIFVYRYLNALSFQFLTYLLCVNIDINRFKTKTHKISSLRDFNVILPPFLKRQKYVTSICNYATNCTRNNGTNKFQNIATVIDVRTLSRNITSNIVPIINQTT